MHEERKWTLKRLCINKLKKTKMNWKAFCSSVFFSLAGMYCICLLILLAIDGYYICCDDACCRLWRANHQPQIEKKNPKNQNAIPVSQPKSRHKRLFITFAWLFDCLNTMKLKLSIITELEFKMKITVSI